MREKILRNPQTFVCFCFLLFKDRPKSLVFVYIYIYVNFFVFSKFVQIPEKNNIYSSATSAVHFIKCV